MKELSSEFFKYVSRNIAGMVGISAYVLVDTFFISVAGGADGITVLNLALPLYGLIFAIGSMIGVGSATRFSIRRAAGDKAVNELFAHSIMWQLIFSIPFVLLGVLAPKAWLFAMGGDSVIAELGKSYVQIALLGTPFFMVNYSFTAFARNDNGPTVAMVAAVGASVFNIVFDYIFVFPLGMGIAGAALATAIAPVVSCFICCIHYFGKKSTIRLELMAPDIVLLFKCSKLGVAAFVGEISSAITTTVFNFLILKIAGNIGVAAYGVVANLAIVAMALFNGVAQGMQPLLSDSYGRGKNDEVREFLRLGIIMAVVMEIILIALAYMFTDVFVGIFNSEGNTALAQYAFTALRLYFLGYIFAGINIVVVAYYAAVGESMRAFIASILRGAVAIVVCAIVMSMLWGLNGIWLSFMAAELITFGYCLFTK